MCTVQPPQKADNHDVFGTVRLPQNKEKQRSWRMLHVCVCVCGVVVCCVMCTCWRACVYVCARMCLFVRVCVCVCVFVCLCAYGCCFVRRGGVYVLAPRLCTAHRRGRSATGGVPPALPLSPPLRRARGSEKYQRKAVKVQRKAAKGQRKAVRGQRKAAKSQHKAVKDQHKASINNLRC